MVIVENDRDLYRVVDKTGKSVAVKPDRKPAQRFFKAIEQSKAAYVRHFLCSPALTFAGEAER